MKNMRFKIDDNLRAKLEQSKNRLQNLEQSYENDETDESEIEIDAVDFSQHCSERCFMDRTNVGPSGEITHGISMVFNRFQA